MIAVRFLFGSTGFQCSSISFIVFSSFARIFADSSGLNTGPGCARTRPVCVLFLSFFSFLSASICAISSSVTRARCAEPGSPQTIGFFANLCGFTGCLRSVLSTINFCFLKALPFRVGCGDRCGGLLKFSVKFTSTNVG